MMYCAPKNQCWNCGASGGHNFHLVDPAQIVAQIVVCSVCEEEQ